MLLDKKSITADERRELKILEQLELLLLEIMSVISKQKMFFQTLKIMFVWRF